MLRENQYHGVGQQEGQQLGGGGGGGGARGDGETAWRQAGGGRTGIQGNRLRWEPAVAVGGKHRAA